MKSGTSYKSFKYGIAATVLTLINKNSSVGSNATNKGFPFAEIFIPFLVMLSRIFAI